MTSLASENGRTENPDLSILVAEDEPADPLAWLLGAPLPVKNGYMLAPADDAERIDFLGQIPRQLAIRELVARNDLVHRERQRTGKVAGEFSILAFVRRLDEVAPQGPRDGEDLFIGLLGDGRDRFRQARYTWHYFSSPTR
jgi:hypothetical protein